MSCSSGMRCSASLSGQGRNICAHEGEAWVVNARRGAVWIGLQRRGGARRVVGCLPLTKDALDLIDGRNCVGDRPLLLMLLALARLSDTDHRYIDPMLRKKVLSSAGKEG